MSLHWSWRKKLFGTSGFFSSKSIRFEKIEEIQVSIKCMVNWWLTSLQSTSTSAFSMVFTSQPPFLICPLLRCCVFCMFIFRKQKNKRRHMQLFAVVHGLCRLEGLLIAGGFFHSTGDTSNFILWTNRWFNFRNANLKTKTLGPSMKRIAYSSNYHHMNKMNQLYNA